MSILKHLVDEACKAEPSSSGKVKIYLSLSEKSFVGHITKETEHFVVLNETHDSLPAFIPINKITGVKLLR